MHEVAPLAEHEHGLRPDLAAHGVAQRAETAAIERQSLLHSYLPILLLRICPR